MKKLLLILLPPILLISCSSNNEDKELINPIKNLVEYPNINEVIDQFFESYQFKGLKEKPKKPKFGPTYRFQYEFHKKPTGWHVVVLQKQLRKNNQIIHKKIKDEVFWSLDSNRYLTIDYPLRLANSSFDPKPKYLKEMKKKRLFNSYPKWDSYYNMFPYIGYNGSELDNIKLLQDIENLPDSLLYVLGRNYEDYSQIFLDSIRLADVAMRSPEATVLNNKELKLKNKDHFEDYKYYLRKATETYKKVESVNPEFETIVGEIKVKLSNTVLEGFLFIKIHEGYNKAKKELTDSLYDPFIINMAKNYLNSCDKNAILFTNGDNDTYPLLYVQEVESIRTDVKVVNLSLLNTDWYIDEMKKTSHDAVPIPSSLDHKTYTYTPISSSREHKDYVDLKKVIYFINSKNAKDKIRVSEGLINYCPTRKLKLTVDKQKVKSFVPAEYHDKIVDEIRWELKGKGGRGAIASGIYKNQLMVLDILANFNWERPIYFAITVGRDNFMGLEKHFQLEGLAYRLVPYIAKSLEGKTGFVNTDKMYDRLMNHFKWDGVRNTVLIQRMSMNIRNNYSRLAESLLQKGETEKAIETLDKCMAEFPKEVIKLSYFSIPIIDIYYKLNEKRKGSEMLVTMIDTFLIANKKLKESNRDGNNLEFKFSSQVLGSLSRVLQIYKVEDLTFNYSESNGVYYKEKEGVKEEIDYTTYRINTFMDEFLLLQEYR